VVSGDTPHAGASGCLNSFTIVFSHNVPKVPTIEACFLTKPSGRYFYMMPISKDSQYLSAGVPELENYLLSKELYYPIGANLPQLTLGGILLSLARMGARGAQFEAQVETIRSRWQSAWDAKSSREIKARSELWMNYLSEYRDDPRAGVRLYPQNVRYRVMMSLLGKIEDDADVFLKGVFREGKFVWEAECAPNFPHETFWYLYGTLKE
jgi:hypothetical protein